MEHLYYNINTTKCLYTYVHILYIHIYIYMCVYVHMCFSKARGLCVSPTQTTYSSLRGLFASDRCISSKASCARFFLCRRRMRWMCLGVKRWLSHCCRPFNHRSHTEQWIGVNHCSVKRRSSHCTHNITLGRIAAPTWIIETMDNTNNSMAKSIVLCKQMVYPCTGRPCAGELEASLHNCHTTILSQNECGVHSFERIVVYVMVKRISPCADTPCAGVPCICVPHLSHTCVHRYVICFRIIHTYRTPHRFPIVLLITQASLRRSTPLRRP